MQVVNGKGKSGNEGQCEQDWRGAKQGRSEVVLGPPTDWAVVGASG